MQACCYFSLNLDSHFLNCGLPCLVTQALAGEPNKNGPDGPFDQEWLFC